MEYPGSIVKKPIRVAILAVFILLFLILAPALIMYTSGYRYDWKEGIFNETGAINIDIEPKNALVIINDIPIKSRMPVKLKDRLPGKYQLYIGSSGYFDWNKEIEVKNKQTVYIKEISLIKSNLPQILIDGDLSDVSISQDKSFLTYTKNKDDLKEIILYNINKNEEVSLFEFNNNTIFKATWAPNNNYIAISEINPPHNNLIIINANQPDKKIDLMALTRYPISKFQWKETPQPEIYYSTDLRLMSFVPNTEQRYVLSRNNWIDWYMENGQLWAIQKNTSTEQIMLIKDALGFLEIVGPENLFESNEQNLQIIGVIHNHAILKKIDRSDIILLSKNKKHKISGENYLVSPYNNWLIIWTPWEIWTFAKTDSEPNLLTRSGEGLSQIVALDKYNTLALIWDNKATALFPYYLVSHNLIEAKISSIAVDPKKQTLYFSTEIEGKKGIWQLSY